MTSKELLEELLRLTPAERIQLVEDLWDSIGAAEMPPLSLDGSAERSSGDALHTIAILQQGTPWEEVRARIRSRLE